MSKKSLSLNNLHDFDFSWLDLNETDTYNLTNPMLGRSIQDIERPDLHLVRILCQPKYFGYTANLLLNIKLLPIQIAILQELWVRPFPMFIASRGFGKTFMLAVYAFLKCLLVPGTKVVVVGAAFRQSKFILEYMEAIYKNAPILRSILNEDSRLTKDVDRWTFKINDSSVIAIPVGDGSKIRGLRAHTIIADEFASINPAIYETVISGFTSVSSTPVENVRRAAKRKAMKKSGVWSEGLEDEYHKQSGNQSIISGTADYDFKHFAGYWKRYKGILDSRGNPRLLYDVFNGDIPDHFNWKDYSIIRIPYELIPEGFMDERQVGRAKATVHGGIYQCEYGAVFTTDSQGFFKRSLIEGCVTSDVRPVRGLWFDALTRGNPKMQYVYGIDPASQVDNFTIVVLELHPDHTRVVYTWASNKQNFKDRKKVGLTLEHDYNSFCARKIRDLMKTFPPVRIGMDSQGGGHSVMESLSDLDKIREGEQPIWEVITEEEEKDTDNNPGLHIVELINFAKYDWTVMANTNLRKDMEDKALLFPRFDNITLGLSAEDDAQAYKAGDKSRLYDSLEDCVLEIEELKNELALIEMTRTGNRDHWDTPEIKTIEGRKGRLHKDRYSALVIANMLARNIQRTLPEPDYKVIGGTVRDLALPDKLGSLYESHSWYQPDPDALQAIRRE